MKKIKLFIYNFGQITLIADFKNNEHDAVKTMKFLNDEFARNYGTMPENIFYYLTYEVKKRKCKYVDFTQGNLYPNDDSVYMRKIDSIVALMEAQKG